MAEKKPQTSADLIRALAQAFDAVPPQNLDEARQELQSLGLDPDKIAKRLGNFAREVLKSSPLNWRAQAEEGRTAALRKLQAIRRPQKPRHELEADIRKALTHARPESREAARAFFHKLEGEASDSDLASLLAQLEFLERSNKESE